MKKVVIASLALVIVLLSSGVLLAEESNGFWFRAGPAYRWGTSVEVTGRSYVESLGITAARPFLRLPLADVGPLGEFADRTYDDGFVNIDDITPAGGAGLPGPGFTGFFGYQNASQLIPQQSLTYTRSGGEQLRRTMVPGDPINYDVDADGMGVELAVGYSLLSLQQVDVDAVFALRFFRNDNKSFTASTYSESYIQDRLAIRDVYNVPLLDPNDPTSTVFIPPAPHVGTFSSGNAGPLNIPDERDVVVVSSSRWSAENRIDMRVESSLYEFRLGPQLSLRPVEQVAIHLTPSVSMNLVDVEILRTEEFVEIRGGRQSRVLNSWTDRVDETKFIWGAGIQAALEVGLTDRLSAQINGSYDYFESATFQVGPNSVKIDPTGFTVGAALVYALGGADRVAE